MSVRWPVVVALASALVCVAADRALPAPAPAAPVAQAPPKPAGPPPVVPARLPKASEVPARQGLIPNGTFAPDFSLPRLDAAGGTLTLSKVIGPTRTGKADALIVAFMASWCGICQNSRPTLKALADAHGERLAIVVVSTDSSDEGARVEAAKMKEAGLAVPVVRADAATLAAWLGGDKGVPRYFFVNRVGEILVKDAGYGAKVASMMPKQAAFTLAHPDAIAR